jgi:acyl-CoA synthetase (AMP-forming)/AMP-acid ligase II
LKNKLEPHKRKQKQERILMSYQIDDEGDSISICDLETGDVLPEGATGEIVVCGPSGSEGYFGAAGNKGSGTDFSVKTGDTGFIKDGFLYVAGRIKEIVIVRGVNYNAKLGMAVSVAP